MTPDILNPSKKIKYIRLTKGIPQGEMAKKLKVKQQYLSDVENGRKRVTHELLFKFGKAMDMKSKTIVELMELI